MLNAIDDSYKQKIVFLKPGKGKSGKRPPKHQRLEVGKCIERESINCPQIEKCEEDKPSDVLEAQFVRAFCQPKGRLLLQHMIDALVESTVGELNFDLKKNITVDLYANEKE
jgi:hypothetical protein